MAKDDTLPEMLDDRGWQPSPPPRERQRTATPIMAEDGSPTTHPPVNWNAFLMNPYVNNNNVALWILRQAGNATISIKDDIYNKHFELRIIGS